MQMGPDPRRLWLLVELEDGGKHELGPYERDALIGLIATFGTRYAGVDVKLLVDPDTDAIRIAYDGYTDGQSVGD